MANSASIIISATYCVEGMPNTAPDGFIIPFAAGHSRRMPRLVAGPFRYLRHADSYLDLALRYAHVPVKQAVISPSALSLMYPAAEIPGYPRDAFIEDLLREHEIEVRNCPEEGRLQGPDRLHRGTPGGQDRPIRRAIAQFHRAQQPGAGTLLGGRSRQYRRAHLPSADRDSTHSGDVDYADLLPSLFELKVGNFYVALAGEPDRGRVLEIIRANLKPDQRVFVGVISPIDPRLETPEEVRDRVLEAAGHIPLAQLGTTDDCGFSPFCDDTSTTRDLAFAKIRARVLGTVLAAETLGGSL